MARVGWRIRWFIRDALLLHRIRGRPITSGPHTNGNAVPGPSSPLIPRRVMLPHAEPEASARGGPKPRPTCDRHPSGDNDRKSVGRAQHLDPAPRDTRHPNQHITISRGAHARRASGVYHAPPLRSARCWRRASLGSPVLLGLVRAIECIPATDGLTAPSQAWWRCFHTRTRIPPAPRLSRPNRTAALPQTAEYAPRKLKTNRFRSWG